MKKLLLIAFVCIVSASFALPVNSNPVSKSSSNSEPTMSGRKSGYCDCGGKLTTDFKAIVHKKKCINCQGTGTIGQGKDKKTCGLCHGTGIIEEYETAYRCTSCNRLYKDW